VHVRLSEANCCCGRGLPTGPDEGTGPRQRHVRRKVLWLLQRWLWLWLWWWLLLRLLLRLLLWLLLLLLLLYEMIPRGSDHLVVGSGG